MKRSLRPLSAASLALAAALAVASCSNSTSSNGLTSQDVEGSYNLLSLTAPPNPELTPPAATGTLVLTLTRYNVNLNVVGTPTADSGTYTINGNTFTETSEATGFQYTGTAALSHDTLTVNVTTPGGQISNTWQKQ